MRVRICAGDLTDPRIIALLDLHVTRARAETGPGSTHALDLAGLKAPEISFFAAWDGDALLAVGALKRLSAEHGELKSMYTAERYRRRGVASALLRHLIAEARRNGWRRLSLETGSWGYFEPARTLYRRSGFTDCGPFADYRQDPNSVYMSLELGDP